MEKKRQSEIARLQTKLRGKFGDPDFYRWLAKEKNRSLWENGSKLIRAYSYLQRANKEKNDAKEYAIMTRTDPYKHPVWFNLEGPKTKKDKKGGGGNQPSYDLEYLHSNRWQISVPLLIKNGDTLTSKSIPFQVRPSSQMKEISWNTDEDGSLSIQFHDKNTSFSCGATPKGAKLQFSRKALEKCQPKNGNSDLSAPFPFPYFNISWELPLDSPFSSDPVLKKALLKGRKDSITNIEPIFGWFFEKEKGKMYSFEKKIGIEPGNSTAGPLPPLLTDKEKVAYGYSGLANGEQNPRFIAIDLGVRTFASCSVFRLQSQKPKAGPNGHTPLYREVHPLGAVEGVTGKLYAVHERSFKIDLPGDRTTPALKKARRELEQYRQELKHKINARRALRKIGLIDAEYAKSRDKLVAEARKTAIKDFISIYSGARYDWPFPDMNGDDLMALLEREWNKPDDYWKDRIEQKIVQDKIEPALQREFRDWRQCSRQTGRDWYQKQKKDHDSALKARRAGKKDQPIPSVIPFYGQSFWGIDELTESRKLMLSFHTRSHEGGRDKSTRLKKGSSFAIKLQEHIQNRKEDRLKKGAHAIVMHALGYEWVQCDVGRSPLDREGNSIDLDENLVPLELKKNGERPLFLRTGYGNPYITNGMWVAIHPAARTVVFEDLSRYRTREERSRAENGQLMKWAHRAIPAQVHMQGEIFGLLIGEVGAAFSSRFHARTGAPGVRCDLFGKRELEKIASQMDAAIKGAKEKGEAESDWREHANEWPLLLFRGNKSMNKDAIDALLSAIDEKEKEYNKKKQASQARGRNESKKKGRQFGVLLPVTGGEYFATLDPKTKRPVALNADLNAAQNLALRFLTRYQDPEKINLVADVGNNRFFSHTGSRRVVRQTGILEGNLITYRKKEEREEDSDLQAKEKEDFEKALESKWFSIKTKTADDQEIAVLKKSQKEKVEDETDAEEEANDEEIMELKGVYSLFQDRSGAILNNDLLYSSMEFWTKTKQQIQKKLIEDPLFQPVTPVDNDRDGR